MCKSVWHQKQPLGITIPKGKKREESLKTSVPELRSRCSQLVNYVLFCSSGKVRNVHSLSCLYYIISNTYYIYSMHIYNIYICIHICFTSLWNHMVSCNTLPRNQTYSLDHSWCNFSIKSFIIQRFSVAQHRSSLTRNLIPTLLSVQFTFVASIALFQLPSSHGASTRCSMLRPYFCQLLKIALCCWHREDKLNCPLTYSVAAISHQSKNRCFYDKFENFT